MKTNGWDFVIVVICREAEPNLAALVLSYFRWAKKKILRFLTISSWRRFRWRHSYPMDTLSSFNFQTSMTWKKGKEVV